MNTAAVPLLWLCGPSGVGKSTVGWEIFTQLDRAGISAGYLDADQLGLCYPTAADDPDNHRLKARNLGNVWPTYQAAGVRCLILSGGIDSADLIRTYADLVPGTVLTLCRLRVGRDELQARFIRRGWRTDLVDESLAEAEALDRADFADLCVDTDGLSVAEVAHLVRARAGGWPGR